jgi:uncharacterized membrane protein YidH (DUF202 family)
MMMISSISDVDWCCCKWVENRSRFRSSGSGPGLSGSAAALCTSRTPIFWSASHGHSDPVRIWDQVRPPGPNSSVKSRRLDARSWNTTMVYCMTETNLCPPRSEIWECSTTNKGSVGTLPRYSSAVCPAVGTSCCWTISLGIHDRSLGRRLPVLVNFLYVSVCKMFERDHIMELEDFSLKASELADPIDHLQSSSSQKQQSSIPDSRQDCNAICNSNSTVEGVVSKGSMQAERPTSFRPQPAAPTRTNHPTSRSKMQSVKHWWHHNIDVKLSYNLAGSPTKDDPRDHHALERTFLAYIRTSDAFVSLGVVIVQLFILADTNRTTGIVLGVFVFAIAIVMAMLACARFFYQQKLLLRGRTAAGGWDVILIWASTAGLCLGLFVAVLVSS